MPSTHHFPLDKQERYRKIRARMERGDGAEQVTAARLLDMLEESYPGIGAAVHVADQRAVAEKALFDEMRRRGFPGGPGDMPFTPAPNASRIERAFIRAVRWAASTLVDSFDPAEVIDAVEETTGFKVHGRKDKMPPKHNPPNSEKTTMGNQTQASRVRGVLDREGTIDVDFVLSDADIDLLAKDPEAEVAPESVQITATIPWKVLERLGKTKTTAAELADWILCAVEDAAENASETVDDETVLDSE